MKNKILFIILGLGTILAVLILRGGMGGATDEQIGDILGDAQVQEKMQIAVCPTFHSFVRELNSEKYEIFWTGSTAENIALIEMGQVQYMISGRTLAPGEPDLDSVILSQDESYSFLGLVEEAIFITEESNQLRNFTVYTDQDPERLEELFGIKDIVFVRDVYQHLQDGIIVTSWRNTDYSQAIPTSILNQDGSRVPQSRRGTLYCLNSCDNNQVEELLDDLNII